ncbi:MAG: hypothetical protein FD139_1037 [Methylocystaceae bacterium]|nr:MAG: hypothetical protein FD148_317 [Methylocystaceae bacterium]KAF0212864.1 MAG: hypothetical protein FD172_801 [Methylocystaceae bacterium]TXT46228.1 MAG: hypothetical protein FD139_1037 [Methylocystaceae bacterium]
MRRNEKQEQAQAKLITDNLTQLISIGIFLKENFSNAPNEPLTEEMQGLLRMLNARMFNPNDK